MTVGKSKDNNRTENAPALGTCSRVHAKTGRENITWETCARTGEY
jgi:hypothetical protein